jgi:hypothetical protein
MCFVLHFIIIRFFFARGLYPVCAATDSKQWMCIGFYYTAGYRFKCFFPAFKTIINEQSITTKMQYQ